MPINCSPTRTASSIEDATEEDKASKRLEDADSRILRDSRSAKEVCGVEFRNLWISTF